MLYVKYWNYRHMSKFTQFKLYILYLRYSKLHNYGLWETIIGQQGDKGTTSNISFLRIAVWEMYIVVKCSCEYCHRRVWKVGHIVLVLHILLS